MGKVLFRNCRYLILRAAPESGVLRDGGLFVDGSRILAVGASAEVEAAHGHQPGVEVVDARHKIVMPGLVDAHNHVGEAHALLVFGWLESPILGLPDALDRVYWPAYGWFTEESVYDLTLFGLLNVLKHGATTHANALPFPDAVYQASVDAGVRAVIHPQMVGSVQLPDAPGEQEYLALTRRAIRSYHNTLDGRIRVGVHPNCTFNCSQRLLTDGMALAREHGVQFATHLAESPDEKSRSDSLWSTEGGLLAHLHRIGLLGPQTVLFHGTLLDEREIDLLAETDTALVHCPATNSIFGQCAYLPHMLRAGVRVGLGTDCVTHNLFNVMLSVSQLHNVMPRRLRGLEPWRPFELATLGGARALRWDDQIGALEPGKRADVVTIDLERNTSLFPLDTQNLLSMLALNGAGSEVCDAMVDGEFLRREGAFTRLDEGSIIARAQDRCDQFAADYQAARTAGRPMFRRLQEEFRQE